jgi:hypothetical protein
MRGVAQENGKWRNRDRVDGNRRQVYAEASEVFEKIVSPGSKYEPLVAEKGDADIHESSKRVCNTCHGRGPRWEQVDKEPGKEHETGVPKNGIPRSDR